MKAPAEMRIWIAALLIAFPSKLNAECDCDDVDKELAEERIFDEAYHGCRSCKIPVISLDACPKFGFECDIALPIQSNRLSVSRSQCQSMKCDGSVAQLASDGKIIRKAICNNSQWSVGGDSAEPVVCAKPCNDGVCKASHPQHTADFVPLQVTPASESTTGQTCAIAGCDPDHKLVVLHPADGTKDKELVASSVTCTGDGMWKYGADTYEFVMCNALPTLPCTELTGAWDATQCGATLTTTCSQKYACAAATTASRTAYTCAVGQPVIKGTGFIKLDSISCDTTKGEWVYTEGGLPLSQTSLIARVGAAPYQYSCVFPDGPASPTCPDLTWSTTAWDLPGCGNVMGRTCQAATTINTCAFTCPGGNVPVLKPDSVPAGKVFEAVTCTPSGWQFTFKDSVLPISTTIPLATLANVPQPWSWACTTP